MIKVDVEFVRFGISVDGEDLLKVPNINGQWSEAIEKQLMLLLEESKMMTYDFPKSVFDDILDHRFTYRMQRYHRQRESRSDGFQDFGEIRDDMNFEELVHMYETICEHDQHKGRIRQMCEQGIFH